MKKEIIKTAKTLEEAIKLACEELQVSREEASIEILTMPKKGFFGLGQVEAKVKASVEQNLEDIKLKNINTESINVDLENKMEVAKNYLCTLLENIGLDNVDVDVKEERDDKVIFTLKGENLGLIIGKRGETLNAIQYLCSIVANMSGGTYYNVIVDVGNYRESREQVLKDLANKIAKTVLKNGKKIALEPMDNYERKIIHEAIQNINGVQSISKGNDPFRHIVVFSESTFQKRDNVKHKKCEYKSNKCEKSKYNKVV